MCKKVRNYFIGVSGCYDSYNSLNVTEMLAKSYRKDGSRQVCDIRIHPACALVVCEIVVEFTQR